MRLDIACVSVYAFSIENFSRPADEVDALMDLARGRLRELASKGCVQRRMRWHERRVLYR
jgi:ditrans,polycis-polyprenyl diphosphate synthase